jgi:2-keto-4-pentenoate hydratase/2-oxohepta-3-ene-1,7-dioic acid hydratase in catechol pathway
MKFVTFRQQNASRLGLVEGDLVIDLALVEPRLPSDLGTLIRSGLDLGDLESLARRAKAEQMLPLEGLSFDLPITQPGKIFCLGLNYLKHVHEGPFEVPDYPTVFMRGLSSLVPHRQPIIRPLISDKLDFEAELVLAIGRRTRHATPANALGAVAGYSCFNDGTLRDYQKRTVQWTVGKNFDRTGGFGPFFVTADALPPGGAGLAIQSRLNGIVMQSDNTANMMFPVVETIVTLSAAITLEPGDLIVMGTPSGVGYARKPPVFMKEGDLCEIEIEGIGCLANPIVNEPAILAEAAE